MIRMRREYFTLGRIALGLSVIAFVGVCIAPGFQTAARYIALLAVPGIVVGTVARFRGEGKIGFYAVLIGIVAALYLPTFWLPR